MLIFVTSTLSPEREIKGLVHFSERSWRLANPIRWRSRKEMTQILTPENMQSIYPRVNQFSHNTK